MCAFVLENLFVYGILEFCVLKENRVYVFKRGGGQYHYPRKKHGSLRIDVVVIHYNLMVSVVIYLSLQSHKSLVIMTIWALGAGAVI